MTEVLTRACYFIAIILMGYGLRKVGFFKKEDFHILSQIVTKITLTAAIISSFGGKKFEPGMLALILFGFLFGVVLMLVAWILNHHKDKDTLAFMVLNIAGCNIGNFVLPFAMSFLGPLGVIAIGLFDAGNSIICLGGSYGVASMIKNGEKHFSFGTVLHSLMHSIPFVTYFSLVILSLLKIPLPGLITGFTDIIGGANAFLAMLMIGVGYELKGNETQRAQAMRILIPRYLVGITFGLLSYHFLPFDLEARKAIVIGFLAPIGSIVPAYTEELGSDYGLSSAINSISILISICLIVLSLFIMA